MMDLVHYTENDPSWYDDYCHLDWKPVQLFLNQYFLTKNAENAIRNVLDHYNKIIRNSCIPKSISFPIELTKLIIHSFSGLPEALEIYSSNSYLKDITKFKSFDHGSLIDTKEHHDLHVYSLFFSDKTSIGMFGPQNADDIFSEYDMDYMFYEHGELSKEPHSMSEITAILIYENGIFTRHLNGNFGLIEGYELERVYDDASYYYGDDSEYDPCYDKVYHSVHVGIFSKPGCQGVVGKVRSKRNCKNNHAIGCWNHCCKTHCKIMGVCQYHQ